MSKKEVISYSGQEISEKEKFAVYVNHLDAAAVNKDSVVWLNHIEKGMTLAEVLQDPNINVEEEAIERADLAALKATPDKENSAAVWWAKEKEAEIKRIKYEDALERRIQGINALLRPERKPTEPKTEDITQVSQEVTVTDTEKKAVITFPEDISEQEREAFLDFLNSVLTPFSFTEGEKQNSQTEK